MPRAKKTTAEAPAPEKETAAPAKTVKKAAAPRKPRAASAKRTEELFLQTGGGEWNISDCRERAAAAYAAEGNDASGIRKLTVYLKPEEGKLYYVVNDEVTGSIDL